MISNSLPLLNYTFNTEGPGTVTKKQISEWLILIFISTSCIPYLPTHTYIHPSKKVTQHDFDRLYLFYPGFVFIKLDIPGKPVYLPFEWCLICSDCFTDACVGWVNWGQWQRGRVAKLIGFYGKCVLCLVSCFLFVSACTHTRCARAHHCTEILRNKHHAEFQIVMQFWNIYFLTLRLI